MFLCVVALVIVSVILRSAADGIADRYDISGKTAWSIVVGMVCAVLVIGFALRRFQ